MKKKNTNKKKIMPRPSGSLGKEIKARHFFSLAFGCIIGVGWIIVLGEWLEIAGPLGAILGFAIGALVMMIVGLCYAELASMLPVSGGEVAYAYEIFGAKSSYAIGWFLALAYISVTSFGAVSVGWVISTIFPKIQGAILYTLGSGESVQTGSLFLGLGGMFLIISLNYKGLKSAAIFQEVLTYGLLFFSLVFISAGLIWGDVNNLIPVFSKTGTESILGSIFAIFMTAGFWFAGFNIIPQTIEEKAPGTSLRIVVRMILLSIGIAGLFYIFVILSASMTMPWKKLLQIDLPAAGAFEAAFRSPFLVKIVLVAGLCGIITTWNTIFIAASRILFALGRARIIPFLFGRIHQSTGSPVNSILFVGLMGSLGTFLGKSAILPIVNVAGACTVLAYLFSCFGVIRLRHLRPELSRPYRVPGGSITAGIGILSCLFMLLLALYKPFLRSNKSFPIEWAIILGWTLLGIVFWMGGRKIRASVSEEKRRELILGETDSS